ncbi:hypothetical protein, partial [Pseudomonas sp. 5Ae-yellow]|uniref:hypothetical protein n=1 Tax=Pseudomonas sp. 5Ae-yellow TaxID=2759848 RepID=UPI001C713421
VAAMLLHHPHGSFTDFRGKLVCLVHGFIFSGVEASAKPGAVQLPEGRRLREAGKNHLVVMAASI